MAQVCNHFMGTGTPAKPKVLSDEELHNSGLDSVRNFFLFFLLPETIHLKKILCNVSNAIACYPAGSYQWATTLSGEIPQCSRAENDSQICHFLLWSRGMLICYLIFVSASANVVFIIYAGCALHRQMVAIHFSIRILGL